MKKIFIIAALLGIAIVIGSCKKNITLTPPNGVAVTDYFVNQKDITAALAGIYSAFQLEMVGTGQNADEGYGGRYHYWGEARSDNFTSSTFSTNSTVEMANNGLSFTNTAADWGGLYRVISRTNLAIKYFPQVSSHDPNVTQTITNNAMAQAYAIRAMSYFYIIRVWKDAPIWTEPYLDVTQPAAKEKSSGTKIIDSVIIPDLKRAYDLIQKQQTPVVWNVGEAAICAILGDVYMWRAGMPGLGSMADYTNALTWYKNVMAAKGPTGAFYGAGGGASPGLETGANWKNLFLTPASEAEDIWSINWDYNANGCACIPISIQLSNNPLMVDANFQANWKKAYKTDVRVAKTIDTLATLNHQNLVYKFLPLNPTTTGITPVASNANYNIYLSMNRLGDVYLSMAEAYALSSDLGNALKYLNYVYTRARVAPAPLAVLAADVNSVPLMENAILAERQLELFGEGKRWFDLVRTDHVHAIMDPILNVRNGVRVTNPDGSVTVTPVTTGFQDAPNRYYWPISQNALNNNKKLTQNLGYK